LGIGIEERVLAGRISEEAHKVRHQRHELVSFKQCLERSERFKKEGVLRYHFRSRSRSERMSE